MKDYKRILKGVVNIINITKKSDIGFANICAYIGENCPELKESEDERIRESLIRLVKGNMPDNNYRKKYIAWLEKQGGQKPADKVEHKFHKGDWVVNTITGNVEQIIEITNNEYICSGTLVISFDNQHLLKNWTIQDAKDGDVLATNSWLFIFKYTNNKNLIQFHCSCPINGKPYKWSFLSSDSYLDIYKDAIKPATKEQRDLLFQKMKEAGYEWDAEKLELKKIEQKHVPKHKVGDTIYYNSFGEVKSMIVANIVTDSIDNPMYEDKEGNAVFEKDIIEQKPWSKKDEQWLDTIIKDYERLYDEDINHMATTQVKLNLLKSIKYKTFNITSKCK